MSELSAAERYGTIMLAMMDLAYFGSFHPSVSIRGTHVNWTCVSAGGHDFNIDNDDEVKRLLAWASTVRYREANGAVPEPPQPDA